MATINDVAKRAGVSRGTVSNVINNVKVRPEYKEKVELAIKELGYVPNAYARSLKSNRTHTVALILPTVWFPFFSKLTNDMEQELRRRGYKLLLCNSQNDYHMELEYVTMAKENKVDGILSITYSDIAPYVADANIPMVAIERYFNSKIPFVSTDNFQGGVMAARKLTEMGCKKLAFIGRLSDPNGVTQLRRDGFVSYCRENDIPYKELFSSSGSQEFITEIEEFVQQEFTDGIPWDGIFAAADRYAEYLTDSLLSCHSPAVPGKSLQIIGFDGTKSHANDKIRISSMRQPVEEIAAYVVDTLCRQIDGEDVEYYKLFPVTFIQGKTTRV